MCLCYLWQNKRQTKVKKQMVDTTAPSSVHFFTLHPPEVVTPPAAANRKCISGPSVKKVRVGSSVREERRVVNVRGGANRGHCSPYCLSPRLALESAAAWGSSHCTRCNNMASLPELSPPIVYVYVCMCVCVATSLELQPMPPPLFTACHCGRCPPLRGPAAPCRGH